MQSKIVALAGGAVAIVGAALAGGYYFGRGQQAAPAAPVSQTQTANNAAPQQPYPAPSDQAPPSQSRPGLQAPYESARYSASSERVPSAQPHRRLSRAYFHDQLAPYGRWEYSDRWGEVWQPENVDRDFRPYDRGHWASTREYGWTWVSDYEWGSIPFHYGRWVDDPDRGWLWLPGYVWGPGWVVWRSGSHYTGWMPMPPDREFVRGDETYRNDWHDDSDYGYQDWYGPRYDQQRAASLWVFVDTGHVADRDYRRYEVSRGDERNVYSQTTNSTNYVTINNHVVNQSIDSHAVEQASGHKVESLPASAVIAKPESVTAVDVGRQAQIQARKEVPTGAGKPNSALPQSQIPAARQATAAQPNAQPSSTAGSNPTTTSAAPAATAQTGSEKQHARHEEHGPTNAASATQPGTENQHARHEEHGPTATNAASATQPGAESQHARREEHGPATPASGSEAVKGTGASQTAGGGSTNSATPNASATNAAQTPTKEAVSPKSATAPEAGAPKPGIENWRKRHRPEEAQQGNEKTVPGGASPAMAAGANASDATQANGEFPRRHPGKHATMVQGGPDQAPSDSTAAAAPAHETGSQHAAQAIEAQPQSGTEQNAGSSPDEHVKKHKLIVPASVEPSANAHKNAVSAPATDVRSEAPPTTENGKTDEEHQGKKGRHKSDEPGPANAPP